MIYFLFFLYGLRFDNPPRICVKSQNLRGRVHRGDPLTSPCFEHVLSSCRDPRLIDPCTVCPHLHRRQSREKCPIQSLLTPKRHVTSCTSPAWSHQPASSPLERVFVSDSGRDHVSFPFVALPDAFRKYHMNPLLRPFCWVTPNEMEYLLLEAMSFTLGHAHTCVRHSNHVHEREELEEKG